MNAIECMLISVAGLAGSWFLVSASLAHAGRLKPRAHQITGPAIVSGLVLALALLGVAYGVHHRLESGMWTLLVVALAWTAAYAAGGAVLLRRGWSLVAGEAGAAEEPVPGARRWPTTPLFAAAALLFFAQTAVLWFADARARSDYSGLIVELDTEIEALSPQSADEDNSAGQYRRAFDAMGDPGTWPAWTSRVFDGDYDASVTDAVRFLDEQAEARQLLHAAARRPFCDFDLDYRQLIHAQYYKELFLLRAGAGLLALEARMHAQAGRADATRRSLDTIDVMVGHVLTEPLVIALLAGCGMVEEKARVLELVLQDLGSHALDRDGTWWTGVEKNSPPAAIRGRLDRCLRMEEALLVEGLLRLDGMARVSSRLVLVPLELVGLRAGLAELREVSGGPFRSIRADLPAVAARLRSRGILGGHYLPALTEVPAMAARADATRRLEFLAAAVHGFRRAERRYPESSAELIPVFLDAIPLDPFDGAPLRLARVDSTLILSSVGPAGPRGEREPLTLRIPAIPDTTGPVGFRAPR